MEGGRMGSMGKERRGMKGEEWWEFRVGSY